MISLAMRVNKYIIIQLLITTASIVSVMAAEGAPTQQIHVLQAINVPETHYEFSMSMLEMPPNLKKPRHMHTVTELNYMLEGEMLLMIEGQPAKTIKAGESFQIPREAMHVTKAGPKGAKVLVAMVIEQGKHNLLPAS